MDMVNGKRESLTGSDWTEAALEALARGGLTAVAVEPIAKSLGATKGSFYWHFADRNALLESALELWERRGTQRGIGAGGARQGVRAPLREPPRPAVTAAG